MKVTYLVVVAAVGLTFGLSNPSAQEVEKVKPMESMSHSQKMSAMPMQHNMHKMHKQMMSMEAAASDEERRTMMHEHMRSMQDMMNMVHGMMAGQSMMHQSKQETLAGDSSCAKGMKKHGMMQQRVTNLEERLNAIQLLVDQMLKSQSTMLKEG